MIYIGKNSLKTEDRFKDILKEKIILADACGSSYCQVVKASPMKANLTQS